MYGSIAAWRTWANERGDSAPTDASDALATAALVRASDYIEFSYVARFVPPYDSTAPNVEPATYAAATHELATPGFFSKTFTESQMKLLTGVGPMKWTATSRDSKSRSAALMTPSSTLVDAMLGPYMPDDTNVTPWFRSIGGQAS